MLFLSLFCRAVDEKETENGSCIAVFQQVDNLVWGAPLLVLLVGTGIYLTLRLGLLQIRYLPKAFRLIFTEDEGHGDISSFGAPCDSS